MQDRTLELSFKSIIIGIILALLLCGANIYLGLKIGNTISASIPASILAMGILRMFKKYSVLENNISQTIASSGEGIAGMAIFVFPALLILGSWKSFSYFDIMWTAACGGIVGIVLSVLLRKVLLSDKSLSFPEGQAIGQVLLTTNSTSNKKNFLSLTFGMIISGTLNFCQSGLQIFASSYSKVILIANKSLIGIGTSYSAAIIGAGYLVGFNSTFVNLIGLFIGWFILLPIFSYNYGIYNQMDITASAFLIWKTYIRPIGVGALIFSGFASLIMLLKPIIKGIHESIIALKSLSSIDEKDKDINIKYLGVILLIAFAPVYLFILFHLNRLTPYSFTINAILTTLLILAILIIGFINAAIAGYFAGYVGSTNSPGSSLSLISVILISIILQIALGNGIQNANLNELYTMIITLVGFIAFSTIITNENIQDYKSGQIVGGTPYKQQISLFFGVIASALVVPIFANLIFNAYGIAGIVPHAGINPNNTLSAPQASALATLTQNIIQQSQNWNLIIIGMLLALISIIIDLFLKRKYSLRFPALSIGMGLYLPPDLIVTLFLGGFIKLIITNKHKKNKLLTKESKENLIKKTNLFVCGLVAGESLMGLFLAIPFVIFQSSNCLKIISDNYNSITQIISGIITILLLLYIIKFSQKE